MPSCTFELLSANHCETRDQRNVCNVMTIPIEIFPASMTRNTTQTVMLRVKATFDGDQLWSRQEQIEIVPLTIESRANPRQCHVVTMGHVINFEEESFDLATPRGTFLLHKSPQGDFLVSTKC